MKTETKHSKNRWRVSHSTDPDWNGDWYIRDESGKIIVMGECWDMESQNNAFLIASVPDIAVENSTLRDALIAMLEAYAPRADETARLEGENSLHSAVRQARAALNPLKP